MVAVRLLVMLALHPLHASTALVDITAGGAGSVTIRAFADELPWTGDSAAVMSYLESRFIVLSEGRRIRAVLVSARTEDDAVFYELQLAGPARCETLRVWNGVLSERYADQVNLVQIRCAGRNRQLVFSAGDGAKSP